MFNNNLVSISDPSGYWFLHDHFPVELADVVLAHLTQDDLPALSRVNRACRRMVGKIKEDVITLNTIYSTNNFLRSPPSSSNILNLDFTPGRSGSFGIVDLADNAIDGFIEALPRMNQLRILSYGCSDVYVSLTQALLVALMKSPIVHLRLFANNTEDSNPLNIGCLPRGNWKLKSLDLNLEHSYSRLTTFLLRACHMTVERLHLPTDSKASRASLISFPKLQQLILDHPQDWAGTVGLWQKASLLNRFAAPITSQKFPWAELAGSGVVEISLFDNDEPPTAGNHGGNPGGPGLNVSQHRTVMSGITFNTQITRIDTIGKPLSVNLVAAVLPVLATLPNLRTLSLNIEVVKELPRNVVTAISRIRGLHHLAMKTCGIVPTWATSRSRARPTITHDLFRTALAPLSELRTLLLDDEHLSRLGINWSVYSRFSVKAGHTRLVDLSVTFDDDRMEYLDRALTQAKHYKQTFPKLRKFIVGHAYVGGPDDQIPTPRFLTEGAMEAFHDDIFRVMDGF